MTSATASCTITSVYLVDESDLQCELREITRELREITKLKKSSICTKCELSKAELDCQCTAMEVDAEHKRIRLLEIQVFRLNRELDARHMAAQAQKESELDDAEVNWDSDDSEEDSEEEDSEEEDSDSEDSDSDSDSDHELDNQITKGVFTKRMMEKNSKGDTVEVEYTKEIIDDQLTDVKYFPYETTYTRDTIIEITHKYVLDPATGRYQYKEAIEHVKTISIPNKK